MADQVRPERPTPERRDTRSRDEVLNTVARNFDGLGGLKLTFAQAARLFSLSPDRCERILNELVATGFLVRRADGQYARPESFTD